MKNKLLCPHCLSEVERGNCSFVVCDCMPNEPISVHDLISVPVIPEVKKVYSMRRFQHSVEKIREVRKNKNNYKH